MLKLFKNFDGTGREPREQQRRALEFIEENIHTSDVIAIQAPTGTGKTAIAKAVQDALGANVIVVSNLLMNQYVQQYPSVNYVQGKANYMCHNETDVACEDVKAIGKLPCGDCKYKTCRDNALQGVPSFFNPISLYNLSLDHRFRPSRVLVVDEAHELLKTLLLLSGKQFPRSRYNFPLDLKSEVDVLNWVRSEVKKLGKLYDHYYQTGDIGRSIKTIREIEQLMILADCLERNPESYTTYITSEYKRGKPERILNLMPIEPPASLLKRVLNCDKLILLSATLLKTDVKTLAQGRRFVYLDLPSPIPKERRAVNYVPSEQPMNFLSDPSLVAKEIEKILALHPGLNTIIHVTYQWSEKLKPLMPYALTNTPETKEKTLQWFKKKGGIFLAAGCSEGVDLPGKQCELNIIPILTRPNLLDPLVRKRKALPGGQLWYDLEIIKLIIQQSGRSTRFESDMSYIYVLDPAFPELITRARENIPSSFLESIRWHVSK
jgi:Rad3-related DNA helicase